MQDIKHKNEENNENNENNQILLTIGAKVAIIKK